MPIQRPHAFYVLAIAMFVLSVTVCEIITYELPNVLFESLTFKMKVKDVDDSNENWPAKVICQHASECIKWCF